MNGLQGIAMIGVLDTQSKYVSTFFVISTLFLLAKIFSVTSSEPDKNKSVGENCVDLKLKIAYDTRRLTRIIKLDCGELCQTSIDAEKTIHKGL